MKKILIHNPKCSKSREAKSILDLSGVDYQIVHYLNGELTKELLSELPTLLKLPVKEMLRKKDELFAELVGEKNLSESDLLELVEKNPALLERPIFVNGERAIIARPPELIHSIGP